MVLNQGMTEEARADGFSDDQIVWMPNPIDPDEFRAGVDEGVVALQNAGIDVVLMNLQYSPRTETMISAPPYLDNMRVVAQEHNVPLFDRFAIMRHWSDAVGLEHFVAANIE